MKMASQRDTTMTRDLEQTARNLINEMVRYSDGAIDIRAMREEVNESAHEAAESACIYYHWCQDIISQYESDPRADTDSADEMGQTFKPSEYQSAMAAYAFWIARSVIEAEASDIVDEIEEARDWLEDCDKLPEGIDRDDFRLSADCPHGWAAHDYETDNGACFWISGQLDGCNAIAVPVAGVWISYTWWG
jgi:hypothetical protein